MGKVSSISGMPTRGTGVFSISYHMVHQIGGKKGGEKGGGECTDRYIETLQVEVTVEVSD